MAKVTIPSPLELPEWVGKELPASDWVLIDQARIDCFAEATGDKQWIHTDPVRAAKESPFGTTIAHGHLTLSLAPHLLTQIIEVKQTRLMVNPGFESMRLRVPVPAGSRVRMSGTLEKARVIKGEAVRVTFRIRFELEDEPRIAALGEVHVVYYK